MNFDLSAFLPYQLAVVASRVSKEFAERYRVEFGLTIPEWRVLAHMAQFDAVSVREIQAMLGHTTPTMALSYQTATRERDAERARKMSSPGFVRDSW